VLCSVFFVAAPEFDDGGKRAQKEKESEGVRGLTSLCALPKCAYGLGRIAIVVGQSVFVASLF